MKISEVCRRTGLTERTIRYYEEEGLIAPSTNEVRDRVYRDYSETDVSELESISAMRKLLFTVEEIKTMKQEPAMIPGVLADYKTRLQDMHTRMGDVLEVIDRMDMRYVSDLDSLARGFTVVAAQRTLPAHDVTPNFGKFDRLEEGEKEQAVESFEKTRRKQLDRGAAIVTTIVAVEIIGSVVGVFIKLGNIFALILSIVLGVCLYNGKGWARVTYVILFVLDVLFSMYLLTILPESTAGTTKVLLIVYTVYIIVMMVWRILCAVWLATSKSVDAFLYYKREG